MKAHTYEKAFLAASLIILILFLIALLYTTVGLELYLPGDVGRIEPAQVTRTPPFDDPGVHRTGPDAYRAVVVASAWRFDPEVIRVPAGEEITFVLTTTDVIHGFNIERTRVNLTLIPGQITEFRHTFEEPGEHLLICHEYCGLGHHTMSGRVVVEASEPAVGEEPQGHATAGADEATAMVEAGEGTSATMAGAADRGVNPIN